MLALRVEDCSYVNPYAAGALSIKLYVVLARFLWLGIQRENNGLQTTRTSQAEHKSFILRGPGALSIKLYVELAMCLWLENLLFSLCILNHKHLASRT